MSMLRPHSEETKAKMRAAHAKRISEGRHNYKHSPEALEKMRAFQRSRPPRTVESRENMSRIMKGRMPKFIPDNKGRVRTKEHCENLSKALKAIGHRPKRLPTRNELSRGEKHHWWRGGVSTPNELARKSLEYRLWREAVFTRDNFTCVWCAKRGGKLHADHIKPFSLYPELRFALDNGRTLCVPCHKTTDTYGLNIKKSHNILTE